MLVQITSNRVCFVGNTLKISLCMNLKSLSHLVHQGVYIPYPTLFPHPFKHSSAPPVCDKMSRNMWPHHHLTTTIFTPSQPPQ